MINETYAYIIILSLLSGFTALVGFVLAYTIKHNERLINIGIGFSTGMMLALSFFELIPESIAATSKSIALFVVIVGFLTLLFLHYVLPHTHFIKEEGKLGKVQQIALLVGIGLMLHDLPEGFAMANSFLINPALGVLVAFSIALHNIPEQFSMLVPLVLVKKKSFLFKMTVLSALAEPIGAMMGLAAVSLAPMLTPYFLAFAAGAMIYVSIDELIPLARMYHKMHWFAFGMGISFLVFLGMTFLI